MFGKIGTFFIASMVAGSFSYSYAADKKTSTSSTAVFIDDLIPGKMHLKTHTVKKGENYYTIAKKYKINSNKLMSMNGVKNPYTYIGKKVILSKYAVPGNKFDGVIVNIPEQKLYYFDNAKLNKEYIVSVGQPGRWQTPLGTYKIVYMDKAPTWKVPVSIQKEMAAKGQVVKKEVPPGPQNPLGNWWMGLNKHDLGIHSTNAPASIGYSITHGCIRMAPTSASELFSKIKVGTPVKIVYQQVKINFDDDKNVYLEVYKDTYRKNLKTEQMVKEILTKYKVDINKIDMKKVQAVAKAKTGEPTLISKV